MQCWDKLPKNYKRKLESKLQEGKQCVKTSGMHSMYSNYKSLLIIQRCWEPYLMLGIVFLKRKNNFIYLINSIESYNSLNHFKVKRLS